MTSNDPADGSGVGLPRPTDLLARLEVYYDAAPRAHATTEDIGPFTLFVATSNGPFYARPRLGCAAAATIDDVRQVLDRERELNVPLAIEWVAETTPGLEVVAAAAGMHVERCPLLVLSGQPGGRPGSARMLGSTDVEDLARSQAAVAVAFRAGGTAVGSEGIEDRDAVLLGAGSPDSAAVSDLASGRIRAAAAYSEPGTGPVGSGRHNPIGDTSEITGIGVLPAYRGRGLAAALCHVLARDALAGGVSVVFCSAQDHVVARIYERIGFSRVATACIGSR